MHVVDVDPDCPLLYVLRDDLAQNNPRFGCGLGQCGALHRHRRSSRCPVVPAAVSRAVGKDIVTLEGLGTAEAPHPVQAAFIEEQTFHADTAQRLGDDGQGAARSKSRSFRWEMRKAFESLVCRCGSHARIFSAVRRAATQMKTEAKRSA